MVERNGHIPDQHVWSQVTEVIPENLTSQQRKLLQSYSRAQERIAHGQKTKAKRLLTALDNVPEFVEFEENNGELFANIDIIIRGETNRNTPRK